MGHIRGAFRRSAALPILLASFLIGAGCFPPSPSPPPPATVPLLPPSPCPSLSPPPPPPSPRPSATASPTPTLTFTFAVTADMRLYAGPTYDSPQYFRGACEAIAARGDIAFMVSPGDIDPPADVRWTIDQTLGPDLPWYPVVGNHETETPSDMAWLRSYDYGAVNPGPSGCPETTYSFDYANAHFVVLNVYCDAGGDAVTDGKVPDHLYNWLAADLAATDKPYIFAFGHEPAYPQPDADNGRERHIGDSLDAHPDNRDRFWSLLREEGVVAYICGHTHNYSAARLQGVWQLDAGHARGLGDTGARSTFLLIRVEESLVMLETYRDDAAGGPYTLAETLPLVGSSTLYLPLVTCQAADAVKNHRDAEGTEFPLSPCPLCLRGEIRGGQWPKR